MLLFIALPIVSVFVQSLYVEHDQVLVVTENCNPFGCEKETTLDTEAMAKLVEEQPLGRFNGLGTYTNRSHLAFAEVSKAWAESDGIGSFLSRIYNLPFYKALSFTLVFTFVVTPLVIVFGLLIAVCVNATSRACQGADNFCVLAAHDRNTAYRFADSVLDDRRGGDPGRDPSTDLQRQFIVIESLPGAYLDHADCLRGLAPFTLCLHRFLCRTADGTHGHA